MNTASMIPPPQSGADIAARLDAAAGCGAAAYSATVRQLLARSGAEITLRIDPAGGRSLEVGWRPDDAGDPHGESRAALIAHVRADDARRAWIIAHLATRQIVDGRGARSATAASGMDARTILGTTMTIGKAIAILAVAPVLWAAFAIALAALPA